MELRNRFQGMNSASLCSLAGRYDNPIPPRFLAPIDCLKIPALLEEICGSILGHMNVEIGAEAALFLEKEYIKGILVAVQEMYSRWSIEGVK
jgi:hypothetical protein